MLECRQQAFACADTTLRRQESLALSRTGFWQRCNTTCLRLFTEMCKELAGILSVSESQLAKPTPMKKATVGVIFCSSPSTPA